MDASKGVGRIDTLVTDSGLKLTDISIQRLTHKIETISFI
jgi:hypothetical protein